MDDQPTDQKVTNPSAFPHTVGLYNTGMDLRDYFAAKALQAIIAHPSGKGGMWSEAAEDAYKAADAMLAARATSGGDR